jgi:hypothetical protein
MGRLPATRTVDITGYGPRPRFHVSHLICRPTAFHAHRLQWASERTSAVRQLASDLGAEAQENAQTGGIISEWLTTRQEPQGATSEQIAHGHANGRLPWDYARPRAAFSARVRMEPLEFGHSWNVQGPV